MMYRFQTWTPTLTTSQLLHITKTNIENIEGLLEKKPFSIEDYQEAEQLLIVVKNELAINLKLDNSSDIILKKDLESRNDSAGMRMNNINPAELEHASSSNCCILS